MRLHFQGNPQTERQRGLPHGGKPPRRKAEFQDTPSTNCSTSSRSHSLVSVPSHQHLSHDRKFTSNQKGTDQLQMAHSELPNGGNSLPGAPWGQLRSHSFLVSLDAQREARTDTLQTQTPWNQGADSPDIWYFPW